MRDLFLTSFVALILALGLRRPFLWVLAYLYVDILAPQNMAYGLLAHIPLSLIVFVLALVGWLACDPKQGTHVSWRQGVMALLLLYCGLTTVSADFPAEAAAKWAWVWKSLVFAVFLPLTLRTRLRLEATALVMVLSVGAIVIEGGIKTVTGGGGYGALTFFVNDNTGLFEGSTISTVAIAIIPLVLWLAKYGTLFPPDRRVRLFAGGLIFACLLIPIGTEARTGLMCAGLLGVLMLRSVKNRWLYLAMTGVALLIAVPLLPGSFTSRMDTIQHNQGDGSAATRLAVWKWTLGYATDHPLGGGFDAYRGNHLRMTIENAQTSGGTTTVAQSEASDSARAFHSAYFEMLGEQGWPGLFLWLLLMVGGLVQLQGVQRRLKGSADPRDQSDRALAVALQQGQLVYMLGACFVGIAYQPFIYQLVGLQIALVALVSRRARARQAGAKRRMVVPSVPGLPDGDPVPARAWPAGG